MKKNRTSKKSFALGIIALIIIVLVLGALLSTNDQVTQEVQLLEESIHVFSPQPDETISFPLEITGEAKTEWFEDEKFPIRILSEVGTVLANGVAESSGAIDENEYRPFKATIDEFDTSDWEFGTLMFIKSDPLQFSSKEQVVFPINFPKR